MTAAGMVNTPDTLIAPTHRIETNMRITIQIHTDFAAFDVAPMEEVAAILANAALKLESMPVHSEENLYDTNGNRCGFVSVS